MKNYLYTFVKFFIFTFMSRKKLTGLEPFEYEHPLDKAALEKLEAIPGVKSILKKLHEVWFEKISYIDNAGSSLIVTEENLPKIYKLLLEACSILDIQKIPPLYIQNDTTYSINAYTSGIHTPYIVINTHAIEALDDLELLALIGHELGHIKSGHVLYSSIARQFNTYFKKLGSLTLGLANLATLPAEAIDIAMNYWHRMSELTCDRAGLLACADIDVAVTSIIKMAGFPSNDCSRISYLNINDFIESFKNQAREFQDFETDEFNKLLRFRATNLQSHPWLVLRVAELYKWIDSGNFDRIIKRERTLIDDQDKYKIKSIPLNSKFCPNCGANISSSSKFCSGCGTKVNEET